MNRQVKKGSRLKKILFLILTICWAFIIFYFSSRNYYDSNEVSMGLIYKSLKIISQIIDIPDERIIKLVILLNTPIRKLAHMTEYFILALFVFNILKNHHLKIKKYYFTLIICFAYALLDEYHQSFISGRSSRFIDCLIDLSGSIIYLFLVYKISIKKKNSKNRRFRLYY